MEAIQERSAWPRKVLAGQAEKVSKILKDADIEHAFMGSFAVFARNPDLADIMGFFRQTTSGLDEVTHSESDLDIAIRLNKGHLIRRNLQQAGYAIGKHESSFPGRPLHTYRSYLFQEPVKIDIFTAPLEFTYGTFDFGNIQYVDNLPLFSDDLLLLLKFQIYPFKPSDVFDLLCLAESIWKRGEEYREGVSNGIRKVVSRDSGLRWRVPLAVNEVISTLRTHGTLFDRRLRGGATFVEQVGQYVSQMKVPWQLRWPRMARFLRSDPTIARDVEARG